MPARRGPVHITTRLGLRQQAENRRAGYTERELRLGGNSFPHARKLIYKNIDDTRKRTGVASYIRKARNGN